MKNSTLLSIKEFSDFTGIKQSTLRYYDEINLLPPAVRGINNYRYYTPSQIITSNFIKVFINLGVPLSVIKELNAERTPRRVLEVLTRQEAKINSALHDLQTAFSIIHTYRNNIQNSFLALDGDISVQELDKAHIVFGPENDFTSQDTFYGEFMNFCNSASEYRINLRYPIGWYYANMNAYLKAPDQPERFFSLDPDGNANRVEGKYLVGHNRGYYGEFGDLPQRLASYAQARDLIFDGPVYVVYLLDEVSITDPSQYLSQIAVGVRAKKKVKFTP